MEQKILYLWSMNHEDASVSVREKFSLNSLEDFERVLQTLILFNGVEECVVISTCNRTEYYICGSHPELIASQLEIKLFNKKQELIALFRKFFVLLSGDKVIEHLFKVVAGLDAMIIGENQIVHQVKNQFLQALNAKTTAFITNTIFQKALEFGKLIRTKTAISQGVTSVPQAAIELVSHIFNNISNMRVLMIGAGETAELTLQCLIEKECRKIDIINRTNKRSLELAKQFQVSSRNWEKIINIVADYDLIIGSTSSSDRLLSLDEFQNIFSKFHKRSLVLLDLSVPLNFDHRLHHLENIFLYTIDDLEKITYDYRDARKKELPKVYEFLKQELNNMKLSLNYQQVQSSINGIKKKWISLSDNQIKKHISNKNSLITQKDLRKVLEGTINRILQEPILFLQTYSKETWETKEKISLLEEIFLSNEKK